VVINFRSALGASTHLCQHQWHAQWWQPGTERLSDKMWRGNILKYFPISILFFRNYYSSIICVLVHIVIINIMIFIPSNIKYIAKEYA
jgi:hypothetical protein